jgi:transposase InsO family protein
LPDIETPTVADKLLTEFICRYGLPLPIHTDQGAQFTSHLFVELCQRLSICKTRNNPFHPQSSGLVERLNRTIADMLSKFCFQTPERLGQIPTILYVGTQVFCSRDSR